MIVTVSVPGLLRDCVGGSASFEVEATTLAEAIEAIRRDKPLLRVHVWDDAGKLRQHVLLFYNDTATRWLPTLDVPLEPRDRIAIVQAISGG